MFGGKWNSGFNTDNLALEARQKATSCLAEG